MTTAALRPCLCLCLISAALGFTPSANLPDLLTASDGSAIVTATQWESRRLELKQLLETHILGTLPAETPTLTSAVAINSTLNSSSGISSCYLRLAFHANQTAVKFDIELAWPSRASTPLPAFLTQWNHRAWGLQGVQRGYMMVLYPGADTRDASGAFRAAYPGATFHKILARAFVASRVLDFLLGSREVHGMPSLPPIDHERICITGHSRNGKQSIVAAAFDERISAVVGSSPGTPVSAPVRFSSPDFNGETTTYVTPHRDWWLPSLRSYFGREDELPADGHMILALVAPRYLMLATARSDGEGDVSFADQMNILANEPVWSLLNKPTALHLKWREGRHHGFDDPQHYFDWFDCASPQPAPSCAHLFPSTELQPLPHAFEWDTWAASARAVTPPAPSPTAPLHDRVDWLLGRGAETTTAGLVGGSAYCESGAIGSEWDYKAKLMMHDSFRGCQGQGCVHPVTRLSLSFGPYITASLFVPCSDNCSSISKPLPVVIFLHGYSYQLGYTGIYGLYESDEQGGLIHAIASRGVAVLAWDLTGHGSRQTEAASTFYRRFRGGASRLGAMVGEVQSALDFIHCSPPEAANLPECSDGSSHSGPYTRLKVPPLDEERVYLLGYSLGSIVGLHAAALLPRVSGVAAFSGWSPFKANATSATGGNRMLYETHALVPRLGFYEGREMSIPYDYDELIASIAPRPVLLHAPLHDRFSVSSAVANVAATAAEAWRKDAEGSFIFSAPNTSSDFRSPEVAAALKWVEKFVL